jgi:hypothetical protein
MATQRRLLASTGAGAYVYIEYDDATHYLTAVEVQNDGPYSVTFTATQTSNGRTVSRVCGLGVARQTIPTNAAQRMQLTVGDGVRLDGIEWSIF